LFESIYVTPPFEGVAGYVTVTTRAKTDKKASENAQVI